MQNRRHNCLLGSPRVCLMSAKVTGAVMQKHVKTAMGRKRRACDIDIRKLIQDVQTCVLPVRCKCTPKFPARGPADAADEKKH